MNTEAKITLATFKKFVKEAAAQDNLYVICKSHFDGVCDGVRTNPNARYIKVDPKDLNMDNRDTLGFNGVWLVRGSRDYFNHFTESDMVGIEVSNCCGTFQVARKVR
jgi:hypothetical protein